MALAASAYQVAKLLPREELYGLTTQIRRAAVSVPANIAEGYGRGTRPGYLSFLYVAQGSLKELETLVMLAEDVELLPPEANADVLARSDELGRMLSKMISKLAASR